MIMLTYSSGTSEQIDAVQWDRLDDGQVILFDRHQQPGVPGVYLHEVARRANVVNAQPFWPTDLAEPAARTPN